MQFAKMFRNFAIMFIKNMGLKFSSTAMSFSSFCIRVTWVSQTKLRIIPPLKCSGRVRIELVHIYQLSQSSMMLFCFFQVLFQSVSFWMVFIAISSKFTNFFCYNVWSTNSQCNFHPRHSFHFHKFYLNPFHISHVFNYCNIRNIVNCLNVFPC